MSSRRVLVAESDALVRWPIVERLRAAGFDVVEARAATDALTHIASGLDLAFISAGDADGVLARAAALDPDLACVAMRGADEPDVATVPVFESLAKPVVLAPIVDVAVRAAEVTRLRRDLRAAREASTAPSLIVGESPAIERVRALISRFAISSASPVLVTGERGAGKRTVARRIHEAGARRASPFVLVPCAAMPEPELERLLFGASADAGRQRTPGAFELARDGTLLLTSVDRLPPALQVRVLQAIEARTFRRAGGTVDVETDARVLAASSVDLDQSVRAGTFRGDLFYRLSALRVDVPPLRVRRPDVPALALHLARAVARELDRPAPDEVRAAGGYFDHHLWPGNVRELRHLVEHALLFRGADDHGPLDLIQPVGALAAARDPLALGGRGGNFTLPAEGVSLEDVERTLVAQALARTGGNQTKAAALLSIHRDQMRYRIEKFGLKT